MFTLSRNEVSANAWRVDDSEVHKGFPKESFYDSDSNNNVTANILLYCCEIIHESHMFAFSLHCGELHINLPVNVEMQILLAQIDSLIDFLRSKGQLDTTISFIEQGHQLIVSFARHESLIRISVASLAGEPLAQAILPFDECATSVGRFLLAFVNAVALLIPDTITLPAFEEWFSHLLVGSDEFELK